MLLGELEPPGEPGSLGGSGPLGRGAGSRRDVSLLGGLGFRDCGGVTFQTRRRSLDEGDGHWEP